MESTAFSSAFFPKGSTINLRIVTSPKLQAAMQRFQKNKNHQASIEKPPGLDFRVWLF
jgi:hypothetical protein